jgi:hypothetical protein
VESNAQPLNLDLDLLLVHVVLNLVVVLSTCTDVVNVLYLGVAPKENLFKCMFSPYDPVCPNNGKKSTQILKMICKKFHILLEGYKIFDRTFGEMAILEYRLYKFLKLCRERSHKFEQGSKKVPNPRTLQLLSVARFLPTNKAEVSADIKDGLFVES